MTNSNGNFVICSLDFDWKCDDFVIPNWNKLVVYELHIGTFYRGKNKESVGTFDDAIKRLPYLKALGINCIELLPITEFSGDISWGYNPATFAVERDYGGPKAFEKFIDEAHLLGIAVINAKGLKAIFNSICKGYDEEDFDTVTTELSITKNQSYDSYYHMLSLPIDAYAVSILVS